MLEIGKLCQEYLNKYKKYWKLVALFIALALSSALRKTGKLTHVKTRPVLLFSTFLKDVAQNNIKHVYLASEFFQVSTLLLMKICMCILVKFENGECFILGYIEKYSKWDYII